MSQKMRFLFINGRGSSGKDTQADLLIKNEYVGKSVKISTGDLVRDSKDPTNRFHELFKPFLEGSENGGLVPDSAILVAVSTLISEYQEQGIDTFIFTGFPRTEAQLEAVDGWIGQMRELGNEVDTDFICYDVTADISRERAAIRVEQTKAAQLEWDKLNLVGKAEGKRPEVRRDDQPEVVERRLAEYAENTSRTMDMIEARGKLIKIDASVSIPEVRAETQRRLGLENRTVGEGQTGGPADDRRRR